MMNNDRNYLMMGGISFVTGLLVGGIGGVLYAPQSGARTRRRLQDFAEEVNEQVDTVVRDARRKMSKVFENGRRLVHA